jgi:small-conductance mechanosensitive channel
MNFLADLFSAENTLNRVLLLVGIAVLAHGLALLIRNLTLRASGRVELKSFAKIRTIIHLISGLIIFAVYFAAFGRLLSEFGISLTAYMASASVIGLAVAFGSQSIVQDFITGLTVILTDLLTVDDMVEISGQTGIVKAIGMRFTVLQNAMGAEVYIPNRTLTSMINYPRGYVRCLVDINLDPDEQTRLQMLRKVEEHTNGLLEQFPGIFRGPVIQEEVKTTASGKRFVRIQFKIWPGRGAPIETTYRQDMLASVKKLNPQYMDSWISINYEVDPRPA